MNNKKMIAVIVSCMILMTVMLLTACGAESPNNSALDAAAPDDDTVLTIEGTLAEKNDDQLFEQSSLLILGTVVGDAHAFQVKNAAGKTANFTDYEIEVADTLRGSSEKTSVTVRVQGGTAGGVTETYTPEPELKTGEEYLLFLYQPARGGAFNTEGDYYYILGLTQGIFQKISGNAEPLLTDVYQSQSGFKITYGELIGRADDYPVDEQYFRTEYIENQKRNLASGFITQKEYDQLMENIDTYAVVVSE